MSAHDVTLVFEDGRSLRIRAEEEDTIYLAALKHRIRIETDCLEGACATCKGLCVSGRYRLDAYSDEALSDEEAAERYVLTCQTHVLTDCVIEFPYESSLAVRTPPVTRPGRVVAVDRVAENVVRLGVAPKDGGAGPLSFMAGQYVHLGIPGTGQRRSYSFANPPCIADRLEFYVKVLETGAMSEYVSGRARLGDDMPITGPFGRFYLRPPVRPLLMVAGGTGLAPMLSMLGDLLGSDGGQPIRLLYGANSPAELFATDALAGYAERGLALTTEFCTVAGDPSWSGPTGHVTSLLRPALLDGGDCDAYLCGPPPMIDGARAWLRDAGLPEARIHSETFLPS